MGIGLKFRVLGLEKFKRDFMRDLDIVIPIALLEAGEYFGEVATPMVPRLTGQLQDSYTVYLEDSRKAVGRWTAINEPYDFDYGTYQYFNHKDKSMWIERAIELYGENMRLKVADSLARGMSKWIS